MAEVKWIKIVTDIFDDEKIKYIETMPNGDEIIVIWFRILCLAGRSNNSGLLMMTDKIAYTDEMLSSIFNRDVKSINLALNVFESLDMIESIENKIYIMNWEKHQSGEMLDKIKEQTRQRVANYRSKKVNSVTQALQERYGNATDIELELDKELDKDIKDIKKRFVKPTIDEVKSYINEKQYNVDPEAFINYYEANGWKIGRNSMKSWEASIRYWANNKLYRNGTNNRRVEIVSEMPQQKVELTEQEIEDIKNAFQNLGGKK